MCDKETEPRRGRPDEPAAPGRRPRRRRLASGRLARPGRRPGPTCSPPATGPTWSREAERGLLDFVTIEDGLGLQSDDLSGPDQRTDRVRGRLDAVLIAARVAPATRHIGSSRP